MHTNSPILQGWELERLEIVDPDTKDHNLEDIKSKWKVIGATALLRLMKRKFQDSDAFQASCA